MARRVNTPRPPFSAGASVNRQYLADVEAWRVKTIRKTKGRAAARGEILDPYWLTSISNSVEVFARYARAAVELGLPDDCEHDDGAMFGTPLFGIRYVSCGCDDCRAISDRAAEIAAAEAIIPPPLTDEQLGVRPVPTPEELETVGWR